MKNSGKRLTFEKINRIKMYNPSIENLPLEELRNLQNERLVDLVNRLYQNVPFL